MRPANKVLALLVAIGFIVAVVTYNANWGSKPTPSGVPPASKTSQPSAAHSHDHPGITTPKASIQSFLTSLDSYYTVNPAEFRHNPTLTFVRYNYKGSSDTVFLTKPHYEWVTKYEAHVLPVFERHVYRKPNCLVIDVGANDGIYTQLSAGSGCSVVAVELQDGCVEWIASSLLLNGFAERVRIIPLPAAEEETTITTKHKEGACTGTYSLSPNSLNERPMGKDVTYKTVVLHNIVPDDLEITLLKVDVEGGDVGVIHGALNLFEKRRIKNLVVEIYAMMWPTPYSAEGLAVYHTILKAGYTARCLGKYYLGNFPTEEIGDQPQFTFATKDDFDALVKVKKTCVDWHFYLPEVN